MHIIRERRFSAMVSEKKEYNTVEARIASPLYALSYTATKSHSMKYFHYHSGYEIYYLNSGTVASTIGNKTYNMKKGNMSIIPPYVQHRCEYTVHDKNYRMVINISSEYLTPEMKEILDSFRDSLIITFPQQYQDTIVSIIKKLTKETDSGSPFSAQLQKAYLTELLVYMYRYRVPEWSADLTPKALINNIIKYINEHYSENLTTAEIANEFHISESTLLRNFKKSTGSKINKYINFVRILNAEKLLMETDLPMTEIAFCCGFNDSNYFSTVFKNHKGVSPGKYIKKHKKEL